MLLHSGDLVAAQQAHSEAMGTDVTGYPSSKEAEAASALLSVSVFFSLFLDLFARNS